MKTNDHLMDATRYAVRSGRARMKTAPKSSPPQRGTLPPQDPKIASLGWMGLLLFAVRVLLTGVMGIGPTISAAF